MVRLENSGFKPRSKTAVQARARIYTYLLRGWEISNPSRQAQYVYDAVINTHASAGAEIPNRAALQYTSSVNFTYEEESDQPVVYTCGINIDKYDAKDSTKPLAGAVFKIARKAIL